jgi:hypothetical protein
VFHRKHGGLDSNNTTNPNAARCGALGADEGAVEVGSCSFQNRKSPLSGEKALSRGLGF